MSAFFVFMVPLAVTSTNRMMGRLSSHWKKLHSLIASTAILGGAAATAHSAVPRQGG